MAVPTGNQHQNRCEILVLMFKYFRGHGDVPPGAFCAWFVYFLDMFLVCMHPCCPDKTLSCVWRSIKSAGSGVLFVLFPAWDFPRLSWIMIDISTGVLKQGKHVLSPFWHCYLQNVIFTIFARISCQNVLKIKMHKKIFILRISRRGHSRKQNVLI
jgi:hypothetical protein